MGAAEWIAFAGLIFAIFTSAAGIVGTMVGNKNVILVQMADDKRDLETELSAIRISAYEEYKILRKEMAEAAALSYREFGESLLALREKVNQVELWTRDQLKETRHTLSGSMDMRYGMLDEKLDETKERIRLIEIENARQDGLARVLAGGK